MATLISAGDASAQRRPRAPKPSATTSGGNSGNLATNTTTSSSTTTSGTSQLGTVAPTP